MSISSEKLAIDGGTPVRTEPFPPRRLISEEEKSAAIEVFDESIEKGEAFGYVGRRVYLFEREFADFLGGGYAKAVNSGTSAVLTALAALELDPCSEVICPPISDPGGVMPIVMMNCIPVPADTNEFSFNTGPEQVAAVINERTRAILVAQIMGEPVDIAPILDIAHERGIYVIEDAAQAHGAVYHDRYVGTWGDIAAFSTMFGKHITTGGQGGIVFTKNDKLFWNARQFMDRGKEILPEHAPNLDDPNVEIPPYPVSTGKNVRLGLNLNSHELAAAIGRVQLRKLPWIVQRRQEIAAKISDGIKSLQAVSPGKIVDNAKPSYWYFRLTVDNSRLKVDKDTFVKALAAEGIPVVPSYYHVPAWQDWFINQKTYGKSGYPWTCSEYSGPRNPKYELPNCQKVLASNFLLAIHENWTDREIQDTIDALVKVEKAYLK